MVTIAISGKSGCGATTATKLVSERLGNLPRYNFTLRDLAAERRTTLLQLQKKALSDDSIDLEIDLRQVQFACSNRSWVLGSRLAIWLADGRILSRIGWKKKAPKVDVRVWLDASLETRAARIAQREEKELSEVLKQVEKRDFENSERYKKLYGIDISRLPAATVKIDSSKLDAGAVAERIILLASKKN